jgi:uncharacterized phage-associated protein
MSTDEKRARKEKLRAAYAYLCSRLTTTPAKVAAVKLLYLCDFTAYARYRQSITNDVYQNWNLGPVGRTFYANYTAIAECADDADPAVTLSVEEKQVINDVVSRYGALSGQALIDLTHQQLPYLLTVRDERIPYHLAPYLDYSPPTEDEVDAFLKRPEVISQLSEGLKCMDAARAAHRARG